MMRAPMEAPTELTADVLMPLVRLALEEDLADVGDISSAAVVPTDTLARGRIFAKQPGVLAGVAVAEATFRAVDDSVEFFDVRRDGASFEVGDGILGVRGTARGLLAGERTALNFLQRLSGIATRTRQFVDALGPTSAVVLETRKTTPGLRVLEKYAVRQGGGTNHRVGLFDAVMLKENHFALAGNGVSPAGYRATVEQAVAAEAARGGGGPVIVEVRDLAEALAAFDGGADILLLDNMTLAQLREVVARVGERNASTGRQVLLEASGGVTLETLRQIAETGVDRISVGALTHSVPAIDLSMLVDEVRS